MSFERGSVSCRFLIAPTQDKFPGDAAQRLAEEAIPAVDNIPPEGCFGWATGRHMLDRAITEETVKVAGMLRATLVKAERKIPSALFKAECRQEEIAAAAAKGVQFLKREERKAIAKEVRDRLLPRMPPSLSGIDVVRTDAFVCATATSVAGCDALVSHWEHAVGQRLIPYLPVVAAMRLGNVDVRTLTATSFSPDVSNEDVEQDVGTEFLTWVWYFSEAQGGLNDGFAYALEGPFTFVHEGKGAHEIVVRKGNPGVSQEAKAALLAGKKLKKARLTVARGDETWSCSMDGQEWTFGSLKLPPVEKTDATTMFQERMARLSSFLSAVEGLFRRFVAVRSDPVQWSKETDSVRQWVSQRTAQA